MENLNKRTLEGLKEVVEGLINVLEEKEESVRASINYSYSHTNGECLVKAKEATFGTNSIVCDLNQISLDVHLELAKTLTTNGFQIQQLNIATNREENTEEHKIMLTKFADDITELAMQGECKECGNEGCSTDK